MNARAERGLCCSTGVLRERSFQWMLSIVRGTEHWIMRGCEGASSAIAFCSGFHNALGRSYVAHTVWSIESIPLTSVFGIAVCQEYAIDCVYSTISGETLNSHLQNTRVHERLESAVCSCIQSSKHVSSVYVWSVGLMISGIGSWPLPLCYSLPSPPHPLTSPRQEGGIARANSTNCDTYICLMSRRSCFKGGRETKG